MTNVYHYIITNLDLHTIDLTPYQYSETNITGMRFIDPENKILQKVAMHIFNNNPSFEYIAGWKLKLEVALIYDSISMLAEAINAAPILPTVSLNCSETNTVGWKSGQTVVNIMKSVC